MARARARHLAMAVCAVALVAAAPADDAVTALRRDPVYVDPEAEAMVPAADEAALRARVDAAATPVFVAVLPHAAGEAADVLRDVREAVGRRGTYLVVVGDTLRASSDVVGTADELATTAVREHATEGVTATLDALVDDLRLAVARGGASTTPPAPADAGGAVAPGGDDDSDAWPVVPAVLAAAVAGGVIWFVARRRRPAERSSELAR